MYNKLKEIKNESIYYWYNWSRWLLLIKTIIRKGYEVHGTIRRNSSINTDRIDPLISQYGNDGQLKLHYSDLSDSTSLINLINKIKPTDFI